MEMIENILNNTDVTIMLSLLILLITGYLLYKLITSPIKSFQFIVKGTIILVLGCVAWFGVLCFLMYT
jgi:hypothetical protein